MAAEFVLWGAGMLDVPIKITGGTLRHCRSERKMREREPVWTAFGIYKEGTAPAGLRLQAEQVEARP